MYMYYAVVILIEMQFLLIIIIQLCINIIVYQYRWSEIDQHVNLAAGSYVRAFVSYYYIVIGLECLHNLNNF